MTCYRVDDYNLLFFRLLVEKVLTAKTKDVNIK